MLFQPPPFPVECEADAIVGVGIMTAILIIYFFHVIVLEYSVRKDNLVGVIIMFLMSLNIGMGTLDNVYWVFKPLFNILFILYQTSVFIKYAIEFYNDKKINDKKKKR